MNVCFIGANIQKVLPNILNSFLDQRSEKNLSLDYRIVNVRTQLFILLFIKLQIV